MSSSFELLSVLLSGRMDTKQKNDILQNDFDIPMTATMSEEAENMCNLSDDAWENGLRKSLAEGRAKERAEAIRNLMDTLNLSVEQAMSALKIPVMEQPKYREAIQKQQP